jgi:hydrogenase maturation protease
MTTARVLIAGVGNIFLGDDAFGSELARRLMRRPMPEGVRVVDFGIRGLDLTYALVDGCDSALLLDATQRGGEPGTLYVVEPDEADPANDGSAAAEVETHGMDPVKVLRLAAAMGGRRRVLLLGCEPAVLGSDDDPVMGLSPPVEAALERAEALVDSVVAELLAEQHELTMPPAAAATRDLRRPPV